MKKPKVKHFPGLIVAMIGLILILISLGTTAQEISWEDPILLDFEIQNKNKWVYEAQIEIPEGQFDTMAIMIDSDLAPPSTEAQIVIRGLTDKEFVNITYNFDQDQWSIYYLPAPISIDDSSNYTLKIEIKADQEEESNQGNKDLGTRAPPQDDYIIPDLSLFKIGSSGAGDQSSYLPDLNTGGPSGADIGDSSTNTSIHEPDPVNVDLWAFIGLLLVLIGLFKIKIFGINPGAPLLVGILILMISGGFL